MASYLAGVRRDVQVDEWAISNLESALPSPEDVLVGREAVAETMRLAKSIMSNLEYRVWRLKVDGCSYQEIKVILDLTDKSINNALHRARHKLKRIQDER